MGDNRNKVKCKDCAHYCEHQCRKLPPLVFIQGDLTEGIESYTDFPYVEPTWWCGYREPKNLNIEGEK